MGVEIERRFLLVGDAWEGWPAGDRLIQGYLAAERERSVRVRVSGERAWLTIKGPPAGARRAEFEYEIPVADALELMPLCAGVVIDKTRWRVPVGAHIWDVDRFTGRNQGLAIAEVELDDEDEAFERPPWLGAEVTDDGRYSNARLSRHPFDTWPR